MTRPPICTAPTLLKMDQPESQRIDKWLWTTRFFKTRKLAAEAVSGGKVHIDGQRCKPAKTVKPGSRVTIHKNELEWDITVTALLKQRRPASEARLCYTESEESHLKRQQRTAEIRAERAASPVFHQGKPNKKDRRLIHRFKQKNS